MGQDSHLPLKKSGQSVIDRNLPYRFLRGQPLKSKGILYHVDISGRYFFVYQLKIVFYFLPELKQRSSDVTERHQVLLDSDVPERSKRPEGTSEIQANLTLLTTVSARLRRKRWSVREKKRYLFPSLSNFRTTNQAQTLVTQATSIETSMFFKLEICCLF